MFLKAKLMIEFELFTLQGWPRNIVPLIVTPGQGPRIRFCFSNLLKVISFPHFFLFVQSLLICDLIVHGQDSLADQFEGR